MNTSVVSVVETRAQRLRPQYACELGAPPDSLLLAHQRELPSPAELVVNPTLLIAPSSESLAHIACPSVLQSGALLACIDCAGTGLMQLYWARTPYDAIIPELVAGAPAPSHLSAAQLEHLYCASILVCPEQLQRECARWDATLDRGRRMFGAAGFAVVRELLHPFALASLRRYYRALVAVTPEARGTAHSWEQEPLAAFYHLQLNAIVMAMTGRRTRPSTRRVVRYEGGAVVAPHSDDLSSEVVVALTLDATPVAVAAEPWPLCLQLEPERSVELRMGVGDAAVYRGRDLVHYRPELPVGTTNTVMLLSYEADG